SQYKDYVLTLLFVKYVSDKAKADPYALIDVPDDGSFDYLITLKGKPSVGEKVNIAIRVLAKANDLQGVINNADFDDPTKLGSGKELQDRVSNLIGIFQDIDFSGSKAGGDDLLGDAYEYLMRHFATESGKSKGQFYTPAEVSRVMAQLLQIPAGAPKKTTVYDPTCGSGSLLIKVADAAPNGLTIYGQENDNATWALARMNMILHGNETNEIVQGNTLADPKFRNGDNLATFDYLVANPPFSVKTWKNGYEKDYGRFDGYAWPPDKKGDYAFLLHMVKSLKSTGKGVVVMPHGVLFRGNAEATIRKELIKRGYIKAIIGLPANLFYGTGIPACIVVVDKEDAHARRGIFMIDASAGFMKDGPKNRLRSMDIHRIVDVFNRRDESDPRYARTVGFEQIEKNDFNLNLPRYIDSQTPEDLQDIAGHLQGGIPVADVDALRRYWTVCPQLRHSLFRENRPGYLDLAVEKSAIKSTIYDHPEFVTFVNGMNAHFAAWREKSAAKLKALQAGSHPKEVIGDLSESLLAHYAGKPLIDRYDVYQHLMDYWAETMQDDCYLIAADGWKVETTRITVKDKKGKEKDKGWTCDLIPKPLIVARYFAKEQAAIDDLAAELESVTARLLELEEDNGGDEGAFAEFDKVNKGSVADRLKEIRGGAETMDEAVVLEQWLKLNNEESDLKKRLKEAEGALDAKAYARYPKFTAAEIRTLVVDDKWLAALDAAIHGEMDRVSQQLTRRVKELAERYESSLPQMVGRVADMEARVNRHLERMGFAWK
ncbi:MAG: N-6 DNA methylase, partial [Acidobacteriota bacterium]